MLSLSAKKQINWRTCLFSRKILRLRFGLNVSRLFHFFLLLGDGINYLTKIHLFLNKYTSLQKMKTLILSMDCLRDHLQVLAYQETYHGGNWYENSVINTICKFVANIINKKLPCIGTRWHFITEFHWKILNNEKHYYTFIVAYFADALYGQVIIIMGSVIGFVRHFL